MARQERRKRGSRARSSTPRGAFDAWEKKLTVGADFPA